MARSTLDERAGGAGRGETTDNAGLARVIHAMHWVSRPGSALAAYPRHVSIEDIQPLVFGAGFGLNECFSLLVLYSIARQSAFSAENKRSS